MAKCNRQRISGDNHIVVFRDVALQNGDFLSALKHDITTGCTSDHTMSIDWFSLTQSYTYYVTNITDYCEVSIKGR